MGNRHKRYGILKLILFLSDFLERRLFSKKAIRKLLGVYQFARDNLNTTGFNECVNPTLSNLIGIAHRSDHSILSRFTSLVAECIF